MKNEETRPLGLKHLIQNMHLKMNSLTYLSVGKIAQSSSCLHILYIPVVTDRRKNVLQDRQHEPEAIDIVHIDL